MRQCDSQDRVVDGIISDPYACNFYAEALLCNEFSNNTICLSSAQLDTFYRVYNEYVETNQTFIFPHLTLGSAGTTYLENFVYNETNWDWHNYSYATFQLADDLNLGQANADDFACMSNFL